MVRQTTKIESIFCKFLGMKAREMAKQGRLGIIETADFPKGSPLHEDGSSEYDAMKPLVLLAVHLRNQKEIKEWELVCWERDRLIG